MNFHQDLNRQQLAYHTTQLEHLGFQPREIADDAKPLRDLVCENTDSYFECKTDSHQPKNLCIELVGNVVNPPACFERFIRPGEAAYGETVQWMRDVYVSCITLNESRRITSLSVGLSQNLESNHFLSYAFPAADTYQLLDIRTLQQEVIFPALRNEELPLVTAGSRDERGNYWESLSLLVPVASVQSTSVIPPATSNRSMQVF